MLIPQPPSDWAALIGPINQIWESLEKTRGQLRILTNYVHVLEKRVQDLEGRAQKGRNSEKARKAYRTKIHWATVAKRDLDILKESRRERKLPNNLKLKGMKLYREVTKLMKTDDSEEYKRITENIFGN